MECKTFEKRIPDFLKRKLDYVTLKSFLDHMEQCAACKEEMTIQFLMEEGLVRLEEGRAFDLKKELLIRLEEATKKIRRHDRMIRVGAFFEYMVMLGVAAFVMRIIIA